MSDGNAPLVPVSATDEVHLAERLVSFDTSEAEGIRGCSEYLKGWLEAREIEFSVLKASGLPVISAHVGEGPITVVLHAHTDVVPGSSDQFTPWKDKEYLWGRGAYDMKGATAAMCAVMADLVSAPEPLPIKVRLLLVPDEETDEKRDEHGTEVLIEHGHLGDFVICGEPTDMHVGIQAKGVLNVRIDVFGMSAHGATPWLGTNAIVKAMDVYDELLRLPFAQESSVFFDRPSINLGRVSGGDRLNKVPDRCTLEIDIRFLPEQPIGRVRRELESLESMANCEVKELAWRPPAMVSLDNPYILMLRDAISRHVDHKVVCVGRDGTNDGVHFLQRGIPSVEFGPMGVGHHGPEERVSIESLRLYRRSLLTFLCQVAGRRDELASQRAARSHVPDLPGEHPSLL